MTMPTSDNSSLLHLSLTVNGQQHELDCNPMATLADVLRSSLQLTGTKIGCEAGDCGACTVLLGEQQVCACLVPAGQCDGVSVLTVEGGAQQPALAQLQQSFLSHGAAQCGICTPGMLLSATDLLLREPDPDRQAVEDAIGGTLCRCTGYIKIVDAVLDAASRFSAASANHESDAGSASAVDDISEPGLLWVGQSLQRADGPAKVQGTDLFGADAAPADALWMRVVRSPYAHATFTLGDVQQLVEQTTGLHHVLTASDVPGHNGFGIYPHIKDQPVLADGRVLFRGEAVLALLGEQSVVESIPIDDLPIEWQVQQALEDVAAALAPQAPLLHADRPGNILIHGRTEKGDLARIDSEELLSASGEWETSFVEHAYIEPEAGFAIRRGDRIEINASTQAPQMDLEEVANVLGVEHSAVRIIPTACGGGFGGKLDVSVQPLLAVAAWVLNKPVRTVYNRVESMMSSTKRHPAQLKVKAAATKDGKLQAFSLHGDFNTGAYASWGPTVAGRVPTHCCGPYAVPNVFCHTRAIHTHCPPSGAFRGFGTPQAAIAREMIYDELAAKCSIDRLEFRYLNAFRAGDTTPSGQVLEHSCGLADCLDALRDDWQLMLQEVKTFNQQAIAGNSPSRRGAGVACMWYGCGNTALSNPSTMRVALKPDGRLVFYNGAVDIGQGSSTVLLQIVADASGFPVSLFDLVVGDTDRTEDAGKTSASRQTFVSGRAAMEAGLDLRAKLLTLLGANSEASLSIEDGKLLAKLELSELALPLNQLDAFANADDEAVVAEGCGTFDPPITGLDAKGQGKAYATYAFAAQICTVDVDTRFGLIKPRRFVAAHDVGKAINPQLIEGQIHGGIMQGLGMTLMEEYLPGRTENLHDYLIPTAGDVPQIDIKLVEATEPLGPYGAKGVGEPALVPTPAAILSAVRDATGIVVRKVPVLPHRLHRALREQAQDEQQTREIDA